MAPLYKVYSNGGGGGPIDYTTPIGSTSGLSLATGALTFPGDYLFGVRVTEGGIEEQNVDAVLRLVLDASGADVTGRPNSPGDLTARPSANAGARVSWSYNALNQGGPPQSFRVWATVGGTVNYAASPVATVTYSRGATRYEAAITGLTGGVSYSIGVRAYNAVADDGNTAKVDLVADGTGPAAIDAITGSLVSGL